MTPPFFPAQRLWRLGAVVSGIALLAYLRYAYVRGVHSALPTVCVFKEMTGLPCPLCGGTRAAEAFLGGNLQRAVELNAVAIPAVLFLAALLVLFAWEAARGRSLLNWSKVLSRLVPAFPLVIIFLLIWWIPQLAAALSGAKPELIDLRNPVARTLSEHFQQTNP